MDNPFGTPAQPESNITITKEKNMNENQNNDTLSLTYKCGAGFDAPWIVARAETIAEALEIAQSPELKELMDAVAAGGQYFASLAKPTQAAASGGGGGRPGQPAGSTSVELSDADWDKIEQKFGSREIPNGWDLKSGIGKSNGKPWRAVMPPRGSDDKPLFL